MPFDKKNLPWVKLLPEPITVLHDMSIYLISRPNRPGFAYGTPEEKEGKFSLLSCYTNYSFWDKRGDKTDLRGNLSLDRHSSPEATHSGVGELGNIFLFPKRLPKSLQNGIQLSRVFGTSDYLKAGFFCETGGKIFLNLVFFSPFLESPEKKKGAKKKKTKITIPFTELSTGRLVVAPIDVTYPIPISNQLHNINLSRLLLFWDREQLGVAIRHHIEKTDEEDEQGEPTTIPVLSSNSLFIENPEAILRNKPRFLDRPILALIKFPIKDTIDTSMYPIPVTLWGNL